MAGLFFILESQLFNGDRKNNKYTKVTQVREKIKKVFMWFRKFEGFAHSG